MAVVNLEREGRSFAWREISTLGADLKAFVSMVQQSGGHQNEEVAQERSTAKDSCFRHAVVIIPISNGSELGLPS